MEACRNKATSMLYHPSNLKNTLSDLASIDAVLIITYSRIETSVFASKSPLRLCLGLPL